MRSRFVSRGKERSNLLACPTAAGEPGLIESNSKRSPTASTQGPSKNHSRGVISADAFESVDPLGTQDIRLVANFKHNKHRIHIPLFDFIFT